MVEAAIVRVLKRAPQGALVGSSGGAAACAKAATGSSAFMASVAVVDAVCRECRDRFDVDPTDVGRAVDRLCAEGVIDRRQQVNA